MYDIFYLGERDENWLSLKSRFPHARRTDSFEKIKQLTYTKFFWVVWPDVNVDSNFDFSYVPDSGSQEYIHIFKNGDFFDGICLFPFSADPGKKEFDYRFFTNKKEIDVLASTPKPFDLFYIDTYDEYLTALETSKTSMFWAVWPEIQIDDTEIFNLYFSHHNSYDRQENHVFQNQDINEIKYNGPVLFSKKKPVSKKEIDFRYIIDKKEHEKLVSRLKFYDIFYISYNEDYADKTFENVKKTFPRVKRIHGIKGIHNAHLEAAKLSDTPMFWVIDADAVILRNFKFDFLLPLHERDIVHVWKSKNPINGLVYGYGGVKLFPKKLTIQMSLDSIDMTTSISDRFRLKDEISNVTLFNRDEFSTWRSAFRECAKLASGVIKNNDSDESITRLETWCTVGRDMPYGEYALAGAAQGKKFGFKYSNDIEKLKLINDFEWLKEQFDNEYEIRSESSNTLV